MKKISQKILAVIVTLTMSVQSGFAQGAVIPAGNILLPSDTVSLPVIRGLQFDSSKPLDFNFVVDLADQAAISEEDALKLVRYFMAVLAVPENDIWVNLSPDGEDRIIAPNFGATEAGEDLLQQDLLLKKLSASFLHPDQEIGRKFWDAAYKKIYEVYGLTDIPQDAFSRIWIVPQRAVIDEYKNAAYISESRLKVLMADEYDSLKGLDNHETSAADDAHERIAAIMKDIILPEVEKQVNEGEHFAVLRQVYHSMILAVWFKSKLKDHLVNRVYSDSSKTEGIDLADKAAETQTFDSYLNIFQNGLYDTIREDYDPVRQEMTVRKYVSGGYDLPPFETYGVVRKGDAGNFAMLSKGKMIFLSVSLFLMGAVSAFGQKYGPNSVLSHQWPGQSQSVAYTNTVSEFTGDYTLLGKFVTFNHVKGLDAKYKSNVQWVFNQHGVTEGNYKSFLNDGTYNEVDEIFVLAAENALGLEQDADYGGDLQNAISFELSKNTPNPSSSGGAAVDSTQQLPSGGSFNGGGFHSNLDREFEMKADSTYQSFPETNYADSLRLLQKMNWEVRFDSLEKKDLEKDTAIQNLINAAKASRPAGSPPPPDTTKTPGAWSASLYNDFGIPTGGTSSTWPAYQYGVFGASYVKGPWTLSGNLETAGVFSDGTFTGTVGPYAGAAYVINNKWNVGAQRRFGAKGITPVTILNANYVSPNGYTLGGALSLTNNWDEDRQEWKRRQALALSALTTFGKFTVQPYLYFGSDMEGYYHDWGFYATYTLTPQSSLSFERNTSAAYAMYNYAPNLPLRLNYNYTTSNGGWTFSPYLTSNDYNLKSNNLGFGLALKRVLPNPSSTSSTTAAPILPAFNANFYTDAWYSRSTQWGQYGQYTVNGTFGKLSYMGLAETAVTYVANEEDGGSYVTTTGFYNQLGLPLFEGKQVSTTMSLGIRSNVLGGINPVQYVRAGGTVGKEKKWAYDVWHSRTTATNAETQEAENVRAQVYNITYTPTVWLSLTPTLITGTQGDQPFKDWGVSATVTGKKGWQYFGAYNPTLGSMVTLTPDQKIRAGIKTPTWTINTTGPTDMKVQFSGYAATNDPVAFTGVMPGVTANVSLAAKSTKAFGDFFKDSLSTLSLQRLPELPAGSSLTDIKVGDTLSGSDIELLRHFAARMQKDKEFQRSFKAAFYAYYGRGKDGRIWWKQWRWASEDILKNKSGSYSSRLARGFLVMKNEMAFPGVYTSNGTNTLDLRFRQVLYASTNPVVVEGVISTTPGDNGIIYEDQKKPEKDPAMMSGLKEYGGVDLSATEASMETRVQGTFEGLKNIDTNLINPETFRGFGVKLISMRPIFDLSQVFTPDDSPVMISQL